MSRRRPYDDTKSILAAILGIPALAAVVYLLLVVVNVAWRDYGLVAGAAVLLVGFAGLVYGTYRTIELIRASGGR